MKIFIDKHSKHLNRKHFSNQPQSKSSTFCFKLIRTLKCFYLRPSRQTVISSPAWLIRTQFLTKTIKINRVYVVFSLTLNQINSSTGGHFLDLKQNKSSTFSFDEITQYHAEAGAWRSTITYIFNKNK